MINVCVQGLGFVGAAMAVAVSSARDKRNQPIYSVVGVDLETELGQSRIEAVNRGEFPFLTSDELLIKAVQEAYEVGNLSATTDESAYSAAEIIIVDLPFDLSLEEHQPSLHSQLSLLEDSLGSITRNLSSSVLLLIETTLPPGTCEKVIIPFVQRELEVRGLSQNDVNIAHSFERVMPGPNYLDSITKMWRVYAGYTDEAADACEQFLTNIINTEHFPLTRLPSITASEIAKVMENSYRAVNIAFIDEWTKFAEEIGVDIYEVIEAIRKRPTHSNIRLPGLGVGGYCLTKDPLFAPTSARKIFNLEGQCFPFSDLAIKVNQRMPLNVVNRLSEQLEGQVSGKRILLLGISYRSDVGDTRFTPVGLLARTLVSGGADVYAYDPYVTSWPEITITLLTTLPHPKEFDAIVFAVSHIEFRALDIVEWLENCTPAIFDSANVMSSDQRRLCREMGVKVESIGRGLGL